MKRLTNGKVFKRLRKACGLSGVELAMLLGLRQETISRIENNKIPCDRRTWALLLSILEQRANGRTDTIDVLLGLAKGPTRAHKKTVTLAPITSISRRESGSARLADAARRHPGRPGNT